MREGQNGKHGRERTASSGTPVHEPRARSENEDGGEATLQQDLQVCQIYPPDADIIGTHATLTREILANAGPIHRSDETFIEPLVVQSCDFAHRVELRNVVFKECVDFRDVTFRRTVDLRGCRFLGGLIMEGTVVEGSLLMDGVRIGRCRRNGTPRDPARRAARLGVLRVGGDLLAQGLVAAGDVELTRAQIRGRLDLSSTWAEASPLPPPRKPAITRINGTLQLSAASIGGKARLNGVWVNGSIEADGARFGSTFTLGPLRDKEEAETGRVLLTSWVRGRVHLPGARVAGEVNLSCLTAGDEVELQATEIRGGLFFRCKHEIQPSAEKGVYARGARIFSTADFSGAKVGKGLYLEGASIFGSFFFQDGWYAEEGGSEGLHDRSSRTNLRPVVTGKIALSHARITGSVELRGARLQESLEQRAARAPGSRSGASLNLIGAVVGGSVTVDEASIDGDLNLRSATVRGGVTCSYGHGTRPRIGGRVWARAARIESGVSLEGADIGEDVDFAGATISGRVKLDGKNPGAPPPVPDESATHNPQVSRIGGRLDFSDSVVAGLFEASGLQTNGPIVLARTEVRGSVDLSGAEIQGPFEAMGARIRGFIRFSGSYTRDSVDLQGARVGGGLFFGTAFSDGTDGATAPVVGGAVRLDGAEVMGMADFRGASIGGELSMERAVVEGKLRCGLAAPQQRVVNPSITKLEPLDLRDAKVRHLDFDGCKSLAEREVHARPILFDGCTFHELSVPGNDYAGLFRSKDVPFRQSSYVAVERWLRDRGEDDHAERVHSAMRRRRRKGLKLWRKPGDIFVGLLRWVALHFQLLLLASLFVFVASVTVFHDPRSVVPGKGVQEDAEGAPQSRRNLSMPAANDERRRTASPGGTASRGAWDTPDAVLMATRIHFPMLSLPGKDQWEPASRPMSMVPGLRYDAYAMLVSILSYLVVPLVIGGAATTWLQRKGSAS